MTTIYVFCNNCRPGWHVAAALGADGKGLGGHVCSTHFFILHDMGVTGDWKHDVYDKAYGAGNWKLEYVEHEDVLAHPGIGEALKLNQEKRDE